ncbi:hypothetical protein NNA72_00925 [Cutibacterium acnes]|uniref:hypothetical protein n=1 Tax=Cutibacterium acnes TaxID=1747 RepID=UPI0020CCA0DA|nr:hypothetical protein [Cutibacterium acnes]MCP9429335.1 hypothetical protein [Cutibacterium acnes]
MSPALADRGADERASRADVAARILADYLTAHPAAAEPAAPTGPHATNPGLALRIPDTLALALDVFPAYAGVSPQTTSTTCSGDGIPRLCGGEPEGYHVVDLDCRYSPPMRG